MPEKVNNMLGHNELKDILPHAHPFVMIDKVIDYKEGESLTAVKNITANDWFFTGFNQNSDTVPETLLIEAAAQAALVLYHVSKVGLGNPAPRYYLGKTDADFTGQVHIGDQIKLNVTGGRLLKQGGYADVDVLVGKSKSGKVNIFFGIA